MRTDFPFVMRWMVSCIAPVLLIACTPEPPPPRTRDVEVSISFAWPDGAQRRPAGIEVGAMPIEKAKPSISVAIMRRDSTVNNAWKESQTRATEIEKLKGEIAAMARVAAPPSPSSPGNQLKKSVEACRDTLNNLSDTAVLYLEDVKEKLGANYDKERVERFRKNLGAEELRDLALAIKLEDTPQVRKALADARGILEREVWLGKAADKERGLGVISEVERTLAGAGPAQTATEGEPKAVADLQQRIVAVVKDQMKWDNELAVAKRPSRMYSALTAAEIRSKTDGDGKCHLILPRDGRWVVFAYVDRPLPPGSVEEQLGLQGVGKDEICWVIEAPGSGSERASLTLSEDNAVYPGVAPLKMDTKGV